MSEHADQFERDDEEREPDAPPGRQSSVDVVEAGALDESGEADRSSVERGPDGDEGEGPGRASE